MVIAAKPLLLSVYPLNHIYNYIRRIVSDTASGSRLDDRVMRNPHDGALHSIEGNRNFRRRVQELVQLFPERGRFPIRRLIPLRRASTLRRAPEPQSTTKCPRSPIDDFRTLLESTEADVHPRQRLKLVLPRDVGNGYKRCAGY